MPAKSKEIPFLKTILEDKSQMYLHVELLIVSVTLANGLCSKEGLTILSNPSSSWPSVRLSKATFPFLLAEKLHTEKGTELNNRVSGRRGHPMTWGR